MSSLSGAPSLGGGPKKQFSYDLAWNAADDDDDYIPEVSEEDVKPSRKSKGKKDRSTDKKKSKKEKAKDESEVTIPEKRKERSQRRKEPEPEPEPEEDTYDDDFDDNYEDDFDEDMLGSDDYIPPVTSSPPPQASVPAGRAAAKRGSPASTKSRGSSSSPNHDEARVLEEVQAKLQEERAQHERRLREFEENQARREAEHRKRQQELERELEQLKNKQSSAEDIKQHMEKLLEEKLAAVQATTSPAAARPSTDGELGDVAEEEGGGADQQQRRRQRERERALQLRRLHDEEAARSLFQRLAQDVREVFHELNLSVVAAEKERLIKDERYRKEREARERREEAERATKLEKESRERAEREAKFWADAEEREDKLRMYMDERLRKDEEEREARLKRDLEDRATRVQNERELRDQMEEMEKARRLKQDSDARERDVMFLETQLNEMKSQYQKQVEEVKRQGDLAREHTEELHKVELQMMEKRHEAALEKMVHQQSQQLSAFDAHAGNAAKLEKLIESMHAEMESTKAMHEKLTAERLSVLKEKENQLAEQKTTVDVLLDDLRSYRQDLEKERTRVSSLYTKFELSVSTFAKNAEEDRRRLQEAQAHFDTLRQQAERDRKLMLTEVAQERKVLEQQQEELLARKVEAMNEIQAERTALSRERTEAAVARERQNRDETDLLRSLREREQEYSTKIEAIESDRVSIVAMKAEYTQMVERAAAERDAMRREREAFEREKEELLSRFEDVRRRAEEAGASQDRLRRDLVEERAAREYGLSSGGPAGGAPFGHVDPTGTAGGLPASVASRLQMDLARQRAVLQKITT